MGFPDTKLLNCTEYRERLDTRIGAQALILAAKIYALLDNRYHIARADIDKAAPAALRHRIILNLEGEAEGTSTDDVIAEILGQKK